MREDELLKESIWDHWEIIGASDDDEDDDG